MTATRFGGHVLWPVPVAGLCGLIGLLAGYRPAFAIAAALGLLFVLVILTDLTAGLTAFVFLTFIALVPIGAGPAVSLLKAAGLLLAFSWLSTIVRDGSEEADFLRSFPALGYAVAFFIVWTALSLLWAQDSGVALTALSRYALNAVLFLIVFTAVRTERDVIYVMCAFVAGSTVSALYGLAQPPDPNSLDRLSGTLGNANELAAVLVVGSVLGFGLAAITRRSPGLRLAAASGAMICVLGVMLTLSRTGLVAMGVAGLTAVVVGGRWRPQIAVIALVVALFAAGYFSLVASPAARDRVSHPDTGTGRVDLWKIGKRMIADKPVLGVGVANFPVTSVNYLLEPGTIERTDFILDTPKVAHNTYLEIFAELGAPGFIAFLAIIGGCIGCAWKAAKRFMLDDRLRLEILTRTLLVALAGLFAADFFESEQVQKPLWLLLAMCPALLAIARSGPGADQQVDAG